MGSLVGRRVGGLVGLLVGGRVGDLLGPVLGKAVGELLDSSGSAIEPGLLIGILTAVTYTGGNVVG